ncbi:MAG: hypothetical protein GY940_01010 [bacterium]|nr:hypothetical protein [bacterium]
MELIAITETGHPAKQVGALPEIAKDVMKSAAEMYQSVGFQPPWIGYLAFEEEHCVGTCAFKSPPTAGRVEMARCGNGNALRKPNKTLPQPLFR